MSRHLTHIIATDVLAGKWQKPYAPHVAPWIWTGSIPIFQQFVETDQIVKYGQCWVFGGLLTTSLRALGIPARPLTNFNSAHESPTPSYDQVIDVYYLLEDGEYTEVDVGDDSYWNFHVWCEAWIDGHWNAVDATHQEPSGGQFQMGPAPLPSVLSKKVDDLYDVDFVVGEADADIQGWFKEPGESEWQEYFLNEVYIGRLIMTKEPGAIAGKQMEITSAYKTTSSSLTSGTTLPSGVHVSLQAPAAVTLGEPVEVRIEMRNDSSNALQVEGTFAGEVVVYNGDNVLDLGPFPPAVVSLAPGETASTGVEIPFSNYVAWVDRAQSIRFTGFASVLGTSDRWTDIDLVLIDIPEPVIELSAESVSHGNSFEMTAKVTNPLPVPLTGATLYFASDDGALIDGEFLAAFPVGTLEPGGMATISRQVTTCRPGLRALSATLISNELGFFEDQRAMDVEENTSLQADLSVLSASEGGAQVLTLDAGKSHAGRAYIVMGSISGSSPGFLYEKVLVPLNPDAYFVHTLSRPNSALLPGTAGNLDQDGRANAFVLVPPDSPPGLVGITAHHAFVLYSPEADFISNAVSLDFVP